VLFDKYGFKKLYLVISVINLICSASIGYINNSYAGYFIILCLTMFCEGGLLSCYPAVSAKVFGHKVNLKLMYRLDLLYMEVYFL